MEVSRGARRRRAHNCPNTAVVVVDNTHRHASNTLDAQRTKHAQHQHHKAGGGVGFHMQQANGTWYKEGNNEHLVMGISVPW